MALLARVNRVHKADIAAAQLSHISGGTATRTNPPIMLNSNLLKIMKRLRELQGDEYIRPRNESSPLSAQTIFEHSPLDFNARSIRLVRILSNPSSDGNIQLEIRHGSIDDTYNCLSYVWGEEQTLRWIRLGGRLFQVHQNLNAFLRSARKKPHICSEWLWIDALCIDQSNNSERSHQVQQMGQIFSHAVKVISWLGANEQIARFFREYTQPLSWHVMTSYRTRVSNVSHFLESNYWTRAWITQEVGLARLVTFMAGNDEIDRRQPLEEEDSGSLLLGFHPVYFDYHSHQWRGKSLIYLLQLFSRKQCQNRLDRVFSLLGVCGEGSDIEVDYEIPYDDLAKRVLKACSNSFCLCGVYIVDKVLDLGRRSAAVVERELFGTLSLSTNAHPDVDPTKIRMHMAAMCWSYMGHLDVTIEQGNYYRIQHTDNQYILYHHDCKIAFTNKDFSDYPNCCSVSYSRDVRRWDIVFSYEILVQLARRMEATHELCDKAINATVHSVEAHDSVELIGWEELIDWEEAHDCVEAHDCLSPALRMHSGSDLYTDAPDLSISAPADSAWHSPRRLRSFQVRPYVNEYGGPQYCGVFVYDRVDNEAAP